MDTGKMLRDKKIMAIASIAIGAVLMIWQKGVLTTLIQIAGYILIAAGVIYLISYYMNRDNRDATMLNYAVLAVIGGLLAVVLNRTIADIFPMVMGAIIALNGAANLTGSIRNDTVPLYIKVLYALMIAAGILIFFHPGAILNAAVFCIGAALAVSGLVELLTAMKVQ